MDREAALRFLRELISDYYHRGGTGSTDVMSRTAPNFDQWLLRHVAADMLNRKEQWVAVIRRHRSIVSCFTASRNIRHRPTAVRPSCACSSSPAPAGSRGFTLHARLQGNGCEFHIDDGRQIGRTIRGTVARDGSVTTSETAVAPRRASPAPGRGAGHPHH